MYILKISSLFLNIYIKPITLWLRGLRRVLPPNTRTRDRGLIFYPGIAARPSSLSVHMMCVSRGPCNESVPIHVVL